MPEHVLFESKSEASRASIASYLRMVADSLDSGGEVTLKSGDDSVTLDPPERPAFEVRAGRDESTGGQGELSIGFELGWDETDDEVDEPPDSGWTSSV
jgi:amphi-Trp domain-containing protein